MKVITTPGDLPQGEQEWVMSTEPDRFVITFINDTGLFAGYSRVALLVSNMGRVGDGDGPDHGQYKIGVNGARALDGIFPGENLDHHPDIQAFCAKMTPRITAALNDWADGTNYDQRMQVWLAGNQNPDGILDTLASLGKLVN